MIHSAALSPSYPSFILFNREKLIKANISSSFSYQLNDKDCILTLFLLLTKKEKRIEKNVNSNFFRF